MSVLRPYLFALACCATGAALTAVVWPDAASWWLVGFVSVCLVLASGHQHRP